VQARLRIHVGDLGAQDASALAEQHQRREIAELRHDEAHQRAHPRLQIERLIEQIAQIDEKTKAMGGLFGSGARRLFLRQRDALGGLSLHLSRHAMQLHEHLDLGAQNIGHHGRENVIDRAQ
jgi:hypothetical protein